MTSSKIVAILNNSQYRTYMAYNQQRELVRTYCKHGWEHSLDVARVAYILVLEARQQPSMQQLVLLTKELIYAAGLLHDIGRWQQYDAEVDQVAIDHAQAGAALAEEILQQVNFDEAEILLIQEAIASHRQIGQTKSLLGQILYLADKAVRPCINCAVRASCKKVSEMDILQLEEGNIY